jgi:hypothetical protein
MKTMTKSKHPFAMTLRLKTEMAEDVEDIAYTLNLSRAAFVRRSIRRAIEQARQHELPLLQNKRIRSGKYTVDLSWKNGVGVMPCERRRTPLG